MKNDISHILAFLYGIIVGIACMLILTLFTSVDKSYMHKQAIENGCDEYNTTTSEFQWINIKGL